MELSKSSKETRSLLECLLFIAATYRKLTQSVPLTSHIRFQHYTTALSSPRRANVHYPICLPAATSMATFSTYLKILSFSHPNGRRLHRIHPLPQKISLENVIFKISPTFSSTSS